MMIVEKRKGAKSTKDIPSGILSQLNNGDIETANLVEWLAVDQRLLLKNLLSQLDREKYLSNAIQAIDNLQKQTVNTINEAIGSSLFLQSSTNNDTSFFTLISKHPSDLVRCWATYFVGRNEELSVKAALNQIQFFAADNHFGVREICWLSVRHIIAENLTESIDILSKWTKHPNANIRRFASESTRPRGVWCAHIDRLKQEPELALPILDSLKSDEARYVQDSVGNWLNDASKSAPEFVIKICKKWELESRTKATDYIIKKALRTINK